MSDPIFLPTLSHWVHRNPWTGSLGPARFRVLPRKDEDLMDAEVWRGPLNHDLSQILDTAPFPISEEGLEQLHRWLLDQSRAIAAAT